MVAKFTARASYVECPAPKQKTSPKLANSGNQTIMSFIPETYTTLIHTYNAVFFFLLVFTALESCSFSYVFIYPMFVPLPSVARVFLPLILSNHHKFETKSDTTKEYEMNSIDVCSINQLDSTFLSFPLPLSSNRGLKNTRGSNTFATVSKYHVQCSRSFL